MLLQVFFKYIVICWVLTKNTSGVKLLRTIEAIGIPFYKISLKLGTCQDNILFSEQKAWPIARMNRILDIYYRSEISEITVSCVEINLVLNNTDCLGYSNTGVGSAEFTATIFLATNMAVVFYSLKIYTCDKYLKENIPAKEIIKSNLPFYTHLKENDNI